MPPVVIENPILNSPFEEPTRHFRFTEDGITDQVATGRRVSTYFIPIPHAKKKNPRQLGFETEWTADRPFASLLATTAATTAREERIRISESGFTTLDS